ncbi:MAG: hypothetical protein IH985_01690 [Planctomycetes bacterium]|nr:hypothetical protein [Planctomycetota bacterium]
MVEQHFDVGSQDATSGGQQPDSDVQHAVFGSQHRFRDPQQSFLAMADLLSQEYYALHLTTFSTEVNLNAQISDAPAGSDPHWPPTGSSGGSENA